MTTEFQGPYGPPWDVDVVADVHAGVFPPEQTAELRRLIADDPQGAAILAALDSTVDGLSLMPALTMPESVVKRLDAALAAEYAALTPATPAGVGSGSAGSANGPGAGGTDVIRGHLGALLRPGAATAGPGAVGAQLPRQVGSARPVHPPRRQPVIPAVLPGGPRPTAGIPAPAAATPAPATEPGGPAANITDLRTATGNRPADGRPPRAAAPSGPTGPSRVGSLEAQRAKRRRWTGGLLAAAAVVAIGAVTAISLTSGNGNNVAGSAAPTETVTIQTGVPAPGAGNNGDAPQALVLEPGKLGDSLDQIEGNMTPGGPLANPVTQAACLGANGIDPRDISGITQVTYQGKPAYAIAVKQENNTKVDVVVVGEKCGTDGAADTLDSQVVTR
ncbi:hypothetical protein [Nakamurella lactea]|uniref:hypothetical protein n=1 Tax=Nakamurella lactea TaxID=459515 RepID=UPI0003F68F5A|nr:hypothetical protein [Nakamurella lactea]